VALLHQQILSTAQTILERPRVYTLVSLAAVVPNQLSLEMGIPGKEHYSNQGCSINREIISHIKYSILMG